MHLPTVTPSERSFSPQTVCVWTSGVFAARALNPATPGTYAEVLALAADSGVPGDLWKKVGQANFTKLAAGMQKRYRLTGRVIEGAAAAQKAVLEAAAAGPIVACVAGDQFNLEPHWQNVHVGHAIAVLYQSGTTGTQFDPLAPAGYAGDPFPPAELAKFATAALIFKEEAVASFKPGGPRIGTFKIGAGHALISTANTRQHYPYLQWPGNSDVLDVIAAVDLKTPQGVAIDIEGNSPPLNNRDQVYLVDLPGFGASTFALRQDGTFTPGKPGDDELLQARANGIADARAALANLK